MHLPRLRYEGLLKAHHLRRWEHGGPSDLGNLLLGCHFHHKLVHELGWKVRRQGSMAMWFSPNGRATTRGRRAFFPHLLSLERDLRGKKTQELVGDRVGVVDRERDAAVR